MAPYETRIVYLVRVKGDLRYQHWQVKDIENKLDPEDNDATLESFRAKYIGLGWEWESPIFEGDTGSTIIKRRRRRFPIFSFLSQFVQVIASLVAILLATGGTISSFLFNRQRWIPIVIALGSLSACVAMVVFWRKAFFSFIKQLPQAYKRQRGAFIAFLKRLIRVYRTRRALASPATWLIRGYKILETEHLYEIHEDDLRRHSQLTTIRLEATKPGVELFEGRYLWTGKGTENLTILSEGHKFVGSVVTEGWQYYFVHFGHPLTPGEEVTLKVLQTFFAAQNTFQPFLAKTIVEPQNKVILRVKIPRSLHPTNIFYTVREARSLASRVIERRFGIFDYDKEEIRWEIPKPVLGQRYFIGWSYDTHSKFQEGLDSWQQCEAITKKGTRCKNSVRPGLKYCRIHEALD